MNYRYNEENLDKFFKNIIYCNYEEVKNYLDSKDINLFLNSTNENGFNPLMVLCENYYNIENEMMNYIVKEKRINIAQLLIDYGLDVNFQDTMGRTALMLSCYWLDIDMIKLILKNGASSTLIDNKGWNVYDIIRCNKKNYPDTSNEKENIYNKILNILKYYDIKYKIGD